MNLREIDKRETLVIGTKVIHKTTLEVGEVAGESVGFGKCKVIYPTSKMWYPQPIRNIMIIEQ